MKMKKKIAAVVTVLALVTAMLTPFSGKVSEAADYSSAVSVLLNGAWSSDYYLTETDNEHWYKITIPSDGKLEMRFMSYFFGLWWDLYNSDLSQTIASWRSYGEGIDGSETAPATKTYNLVLSKGTYYVKIYSGSGESGKYRMYYQFTTYGANDAAAYSYDLPLNYQMGSVITGAITETDREDWYKITIPSDGYYTQKIVSYFYGLWWDLYNSDLSQTIASWKSYSEGIDGSETAPATKTYDLVLSKGTYYVKIYSGSGKSGKYTFQYTKLTQSNCTHDYEKTWHDATYFKRGYNSYRCKKCGHSYKGDYEPIKKLSQGYISYYSSVGKGKIKLSWGTVSNASGYQIRYAKKRNMKGGKTISVKGQSKSRRTIKKLSRHKKYYVQVRAYKKSGSKKVYGKWSQKKSFRTK